MIPTQMTRVGRAVEFEADREALDDVGAVAGLRGPGDRADRAIVGAGIIFGDPDDQPGDSEADQRTPEEVHAGEAVADGAARDVGGDVGAGRFDGTADDRVHVAAQGLPHHVEDGGDGEDRGGPEALVEGAHDRLLRAQADEIGADDRGDDAHAADDQREAHQRQHLLGGGADEEGDQNHGGADGDDIGLEQVGGHAGAVADIVADVIGDDGRVAGVVLGDSGLDLADQVGADVGGLGEDAAAETGEDRDERRAEGEGDEGVDDLAVVRGVTHRADQNVEEDRDGEQGEARDQHAGDRARPEGDGEAALEAGAGGLGGADVGPDRDVHADEARGAREQGADSEAAGLDGAEEEEDQSRDGDADDGDRGVLAAEIGVGALLDGGGDRDHALIAGRGFQHLEAGEDAVEHRDHSAGYGNEHDFHENFLPL